MPLFETMQLYTVFACFCTKLEGLAAPQNPQKFLPQIHI